MRPSRFVLALALLISVPAHSKGEEELVGIWRADVSLGPAPGGTFVVKKSASGYTASFGGKTRKSQGPAGDLRFEFEDNGSFRGKVRGITADGFWIQKGDGPGGLRPSYATPVKLTRAFPGVWRGQVRPLPNQFTLWLSIARSSDGTITATFRNPEQNSTGGAGRFDVGRDGASVRFSAKADDREVVYPATLLANPDRIRIAWRDLNRTVELTRRSGDEAGSFFPRPPGSPAYIYRIPPQLRDGWRTARASAVGIDEDALQSVVRDIAASDPTARQPRLMHSILVAHRGRLVLEEYFYGFDRLTPHDTRSAAKTFASVLLGTAPPRLAGLSPDSRILELMRPLGPFGNPDPRKSRINLTHLMTHTSGLACNDNDDASPGNEGTMQGQAKEPDWWRYTLSLPQLFDPGARYAYCSANINLVGGALTLGTRTWLPELFRKTIADPLQFGEWHWNLMPTGEGYLGGGAFLLPRDLLKVGQLYLDGGTWNGRRILPSEWIARSTRAYVEINPARTGLSEEEFSNFYIKGEDGLAWHLGSVKTPGGNYRTYSAVGNGGQLLIVVPEADLAVVFTGGNYRQGGVWLRWPQQIVGDKIIPAIRRP